jgi:hypothetical protein
MCLRRAPEKYVAGAALNRAGLREPNAWDTTCLPCFLEGGIYIYGNPALHGGGGVSKIETIKYAHESRGTQARERLRWQGPVTENYRLDFSSERASHVNKPATIYK